ncbi:MAG: alpha/beta hydrolase [Bdellovibrionaceae bacterium]|nr:alpha/beta hydrolase [Pseudobdellovibrionaceae bacterium]
MIKKSFFKTSQNRLAYFEFDHKSNAETLVFLNGLSDSIESWSEIKSYFKGKYSTLFIDLIGQGQALEEEIKRTPPPNFVISAAEQAEVLKEVWLSLQIKSGFHLVGFSYGGGIAIRFATLYPELVHQLILFLPYTIRLDLAFPIQRAWADQIGLLKNFNFLRPHINIIGSSYQKMMRDYMNFRFSKQIPDHHRRQISMDLTEGIMPFNAFDVFDSLPDKAVHLVTVEHDTLVPKSLYREIWSRLPESKKRSWLSIQDGEHLIFEQAPMYCAQWIETVLSMKATKHPRLFVGHSYRMETKEVTETPHSSHSA